MSRVTSYLSIFLSLLLAGCSLSPSAEFMKALGDDPASVSVSIQTIYGSIMLCRTAILSGSVDCDKGGIKVKSDAATTGTTVGIPMTIVPQFTIAPAAPAAAPAPSAPMHQQRPPAPRSEAPDNRMADWLARSPDTVRGLLRDMPTLTIEPQK
jgi:hypothetical protein